MNRSTVLIADTCAQRIEGITKHVPAKTAITVLRKSMKPAQMTAIYQAALDARTTLKSKRAEAKVALQEWQAADAAQSSLDPSLKAWVAVTYGLDSQEARDMGFAPRKKGSKTVEVMQLAVEKNLATRAARNTGGKRQKAKIKGTVSAPTAPAAPATTQASAPAAAASSQPAPAAAPVNGAASVNGAAITNGIAGH